MPGSMRRAGRPFDKLRDRLGVAKERFSILRDASSTCSAPQDERSQGAWDGSRKPPENWAYHHGEELVVNGSNSRRVQVRRAKLSQWTARVEDRFLGVLAATCNVKAACRAVGLWPPSAYSHRRRWPDFARRWDEAIAIGACELECRLHETIRHHFDRELPEPAAPLRDITVMDAIRLLRMYRSKER